MSEHPDHSASSATHTPASVVADAERLTGFAAEALEAAGASPADAAVTAHVLVRTDLRGVHTHGVHQLPNHVRNLVEGGTTSPVDVEVVRETPVTAVLDGHGGMGHVVATRARELAVDKARTSGMATVLVRGGNHLGAVGHYALEAAEAGFIAMTTSNTSPIMTAAGSTRKLISNAPFAYAVPMEGFPMVFDVAMSATAGFKLHMAAEQGEPVALGLLVDADGNPTTDPADYRRGGALLPIGGHKGYGMALLTETLAGVLSGAGITSEVASWLREPGTPTNAGASFIVMDVECFMDRPDFQRRMRQLVDGLHAAEPAPGIERILVPGELEAEREHAARRDGVTLERVTWTHLDQVAIALGLEERLAGVPVAAF